jgi:protein SCO1/2
MSRLLLPLLFLLLVAAAPFDPFGAARVDERPGAQVPLDGALRDASGGATSLRRLAEGKVLVLVPVLHDCPNICAVTLAGIADAAQAQKRFAAGRDFRLVAFGIDPAETPADAAADLARLKAQHGGLPFAATTASPSTIRAVTDAIGYHYAYDPRIGQYAHAAASAVITPDGRLVRWLYGLNPDPGDLEAAIADAQAGRTGGLLRQLILLCYHYDPQSGTWSPMIDRVLRYAGVATVLVIGALILTLRRRFA